MSVDSIQDVVKKGLCISCGACVVAAPPGAIEMRYDSDRGMALPSIRQTDLVDGKGEEFAVCPGKGYPIIGLSRRFAGEGGTRDVELGAWREAWAARSTDDAILERASSGGVMTAIASFLMATGRVDGAVVTGMKYGSQGPRPAAYVARSREDLLEAQGSKYCPSATLLALLDTERTSERFVFVGTPCQIAGLRMLQERRPELSQRFPLVIGNFCGGFRDCRETDTLIRRHGLSPQEVTRFRYRGGGQPGSMVMEDRRGAVVELPYPQYGRRTGYIKVRRCRLCVDATAELADFSCGDAWLSRFLDTGHPWSIILARTDEASVVVRSMQSKQRLMLEDVSTDEINESQRDNLQSKKARQAARRRLFGALGFALPDFDGGYPPTKGGGAFEAKVLASRSVLYAFERVGMYPALARLIRRY